jgi:hypothetical protein
MRLSRTVSVFLAILMAATLSAAIVAPSEAKVRATSSHRLMKPNHDLVVHGTEVGNTNHFVIYGTLTTYPKVFIFRSVGGGTFSLYRKVKVDNKGRFRTRIYQYKNFRTCFRVGVPETTSYDQVIRPVGCIF